MQLERSPLTPTEQRCRTIQGLCCTAASLDTPCPIHPSRSKPSTKVGHSIFLGISQAQLTVPVEVTFTGESQSTRALIDSGATGNFMDLALARKLQLPLHLLTNPIAILGVSGEPLPKGKITHRMGPVTLQVGILHTETLTFLILSSTKDPVILGLLRLQEHDPQICWSSGKLIDWSPQCYFQCFAVPCCAFLVDNLDPEDLTVIPEEYADFHDVFSKTLAFWLPPQQDCDCTTDLIKGAPLPKGRLYPLSTTEEAAMEEYIREALAQGIIRPSTFPTTVGFFVKKKDGGLCPCIDYQALNAIIVKRRELLPLIPPRWSNCEKRRSSPSSISAVPTT